MSPDAIFWIFGAMALGLWLAKVVPEHVWQTGGGVLLIVTAALMIVDGYQLITRGAF